MRLIILILIFLFANSAFAETFVVTSNADSGPGTLREALQKAADNGISETDNIVFNLPFATRGDRTITALSELPQLTSHLMIDGSTQSGTTFGASGAKVEIDISLQYIRLFYSENSTDIQIYGLYLKGAYYSSYGYQFFKTNHIVFGAPGKGNIVNGFQNALESTDYDNDCRDITVQGNLLGTNETGTDLENNYMNIAMNFSNIKDILIGGVNPGEGNVICGRLNSISVNFTDVGEPGFLKIYNNKIGTDITGLKNIVGFRQGEIDVEGRNDGTDYHEGTTELQLEILNNIIGVRLFLWKLKSPFSIKGNCFGVGPDHKTNITNNDIVTIQIAYCGKGLIGGDGINDKNYLAYDYGIYEFHAGDITISKNAFFCNFTAIGLNGSGTSQTTSYVTISDITTSLVKGTSTPKAAIELFYSDDCGTVCQGKTYIASVTADDNGNWIYNGIINGGVVATATDSYGSTSDFSHATINEINVVVFNASCNKANGAIKNLNIESGNTWHWEDDKGNTISTDIDLTKAAPGKYQLVAGITGTECSTRSSIFTIGNLELPLTTPSVSITNISCGQPSGSLYTSELPELSASWLRENKSTASDGYYATGLPAGIYYLKLAATNDASCNQIYGPFEIKSDIANTLNAAGVTITNATCDKTDGEIKGLKYSSSITADIYLEWKDENGQLWKAGTLDLLNVPSGKYQLKLKDPANCDTLLTPFYTIANQGYITTETSEMQISGSNKCGHPYGSITGIKATNGETFTWTNNEGTVVGNTLDIDNLLPGIYRVLIGNQYGCTSTVISAVVPVVPNPDLTTTRADTKQGFCDVSDGYIHPLGIQHADQYSFRWTNLLSPDVVVSQTLHLDNILSGNYNLYATDKDGCEESLGQFELTSSPPPLINEEGKAIVNAMCGDSSGLIAGLTVSGGATPFAEIWKDAEDDVISTDGKAENLAPNTYHLELEDANGCKTSSSEFVVENGVMNYLTPVYPDLTIPRGTAATFVTTNPQSGRYSLFTDASSSVPLQQNETGTFTTSILTEDKSFYVTVTRGSCTGNNNVVHVKVADATIVSIPSAFTPNGDGLNDIIRPVVQGLFTLEDFSVYDRFGHQVFRTADINRGWKGDKNGLLLDTGTYVWIIKGKDIYNKPLIQKGTIVLIR